MIVMLGTTKLLVVIVASILIIGAFIISRPGETGNITLDFTNSTDNHAWYGYIEICNTSFHTAGNPDGFKDNAFNSDEYDKISYSDDENMRSYTPGDDNGNPYLLFEFELMDGSWGFDFEYEGYSSQPFIHSVGNNISVSIFNFETMEWEEFIDTNTADTFDSNLSFSIPDNFYLAFIL